MLAAALGRGYAGRHRLADAALGLAPATWAGEPLVVPTPQPRVVTTAPAVRTGPDAVVGAPSGRTSVAPWLRVVATPHQPDQLADTLPHPVVTLFPLPPAEQAAAEVSPDEKVFALVDAEREQQATAELAGAADVRPYRARHTA